jgi:hypothetical protein
MNPEEQEFAKLEAHLRQLSPSAPSEGLSARIFAAFETPQDAAPAVISDEARTSPRKLAPWYQPFAAAAAVALIAGIAVLIGLNRQPAAGVGAATVEANSVPVRFEPAHAQNTYLGSRNDGIVFTDDRRPLQTVRHQFTDTYTWENPLDGSRVEVTIPVERVRYVPVPTD